MKVFDLHCDTLYKANETNQSIIRNDFEFSLEKAKAYENYTQVMAIWIPDDYRNDRAFALTEHCYRHLQRELQKQSVFQKCSDYTQKDSSHTVILSVEGGAVLGGKTERVKVLQEMGVRFLTLTWNGRKSQRAYRFWKSTHSRTGKPSDYHRRFPRKRTAFLRCSAIQHKTVCRHAFQFPKILPT